MTYHGTRILITGSHGFLGSAFVEVAKREQLPFAVFDRAQPDSIPDDVDCVVHFAGLTPGSAGARSSKNYRDANVAATKTLLDTLVREGRVTRFVHIGSCAEYGFSTEALREGARERPVSAYGKTKLAQSKLVERFARTHRVKTINLRVFNIAGLPKRVPNGNRWKPFIFETLLEQFSQGRRTIRVTNEGDVRDYVDTEDVMRAILAALVTERGGIYELVNVCTGKGTPLRELIRIFAKALNRDPSVRNMRSKATVSFGDPRKARRVLGWSASTPLGESLTRILAHRARVLIVGAGSAGALVARECERTGSIDFLPAGFVDDDKKKRGTFVRGVRVLGAVADIPKLLRKNAFDQVLISTPSVTGLAREVAALLPPGFPIKVVPSISSVILGNVDLSYIRDIDPSDLIGRPLVRADQARIADYARGKTFFITGGAGSIGSEIVRQLFDSRARRIIVFDAWEEGMFNLEEELSALAGDGRPEVVMRIGTTRDPERIREVMREYPVDVIIHAAAYKHVPLMENNAGEAHKTNVLGTEHMLDAAVSHRVSDFVLISTDKAVHPTSVMGRSKRDAELLVKNYARRHPHSRFCVVRFGNVLNSSGSIVPKFLRQIRARVPITITSFAMTRYFMTIPEAVSLVLSAWVVAENGQILVLDMGEPVSILELALELVRLHGLEPYTDIPLQEIGIRKGEKIHEELMYDADRVRPSPAPRVLIAEEL